MTPRTRPRIGPVDLPVRDGLLGRPEREGDRTHEGSTSLLSIPADARRVHRRLTLNATR